MSKLLNVAMAASLLVAGFAFSWNAWGAGPATATSKPTTTQAAAPACCGDTCKQMGAGCCKIDDKGNMTCSMGGSCCMKTDTKPADTKPAETKPANMNGMKMGK